MGLQVKELGADHIGWMEKMNNIIQKINLTENSEEVIVGSQDWSEKVKIFRASEI